MINETAGHNHLIHNLQSDNFPSALTKTEHWLFWFQTSGESNDWKLLFRCVSMRAAY